MNKLLSAFALFLLSVPLFAIAQDMAAADAPVNTVSMVWVILFGVLFLGSIAGFFVYLWLNERKGKQAGPHK